MDLWSLPTSIDINGTEWPIRTDYRAVLCVVNAFNNADFDDEDKFLFTLDVMIKDFDSMPPALWEQAYNKVVEFIDAGQEESGSNKRLMDWEQDAPIIIPSINKVIGKEVRSLEYMHWWTFIGAYMEIGQGVFASVVAIRDKKQSGVKLEKEEQRFYRENKKLVDLKPRLTREEIEERARLNALLKK